ncbi:MAG TPA: agmatinase family protein [Candidatus Limnocylindrales bacterium]|nr:agmatinase family protein [Candidatus Limnocylindrales bacterium]
MSQFHDDPNWPRAHRWLAGESLPKAAHGLSVLGAPVCRGSITPGRSDLAPAAIRKALERYSTYDLSPHRDLRHMGVRDFGDLDVAGLSPDEAFTPLKDAVSAALKDTPALVLLGGDNSISYPAAMALATDPKRCGLITFDAHFDLRDLDNGLTNGNPVRAMLRDGWVGDHIFQIGLQRFTNSEAYAKVAREAGIHVIGADAIMDHGITKAVHQALGHLHLHVDSIYVDLDLDVLDRIHAPATPGSRPGGLFPGQVRRAAHLCGMHPKVRVMDLVEMDPTKDIADITALTAASCLLEFASGMLARPHHL